MIQGDTILKKWEAKGRMWEDYQDMWNFLLNRNLKQEDVKRSLRAKLKAWKTFRTRTAQEDDWDSAQRRNLIHCSSVSRKREGNPPVITECKLRTRMRERVSARINNLTRIPQLGRDETRI